MSTVEGWETRISRADQLAAAGDAVAALIASYAALLRFQRSVSERLRAPAVAPLSGALERDLPRVRPEAERLLADMAVSGPEALAGTARDLLAAGQRAIDAMLVGAWRDRSDRDFFARAVLQPYAAALADAAVTPVDRAVTPAENTCPFCGGWPQLAILQSSRDADGGRLLLCATCLQPWPFARIGCAGCGEQDEHRLTCFSSPEWPHVRIDACETCRTYLKTVDLSRCGVAVPLVDEVAAAPLDLWARDQGYTKIQLNLLGL